MAIRIYFGIFTALVLAVTSGASAQVLYNGAAGTSPQSQGWLEYTSLLSTATESTAGGKTTLDTTAGSSNSEEAGFSNYTPGGTLVNSSFPALNPAGSGFGLTFSVKLDSESHASTNRAGFDVILLGSDHNGIELGFWTNEIFAQASSPLFTHAENTTGFDPTAQSWLYALTVQGGNYELTANGIEILSGVTRNYTAFPPGVPYTLPNYVFLGDDTTSGQGAEEISSVAVVPEPGTLTILAVGAVTMIRRKRA